MTPPSPPHGPSSKCVIDNDSKLRTDVNGNAQLNITKVVRTLGGRALRRNDLRRSPIWRYDGPVVRRGVVKVLSNIDLRTNDSCSESKWHTPSWLTRLDQVRQIDTPSVPSNR